MTVCNSMPRLRMALKAKQGMIDAAQLSGGNEDKRISLLCYIVDGKQLIGKGNHQSACTFEQYDLIALA